LVSKCLSSAVRQIVATSLPPLQVGVGTPGGAEAIIHSVRHLLEDPSISPNSKWTLMLDFSNAFNSVDRSKMFTEIRDRIPGLSSWVESCYNSRPILHFGSHIIYSCCGVQQGDPLGPLCFSLALQPILERISCEVPNFILNCWYVDDGTL
jgi:hypothetical protein